MTNNVSNQIQTGNEVNEKNSIRKWHIKWQKQK